ncbi:MAG: flagellar basal body L-ring protein FlgH [Phycisphaerales bacterium]|nr:flagellar basal body L-ring protein FlgH [Phycisphaerales bacterium]
MTRLFLPALVAVSPVLLSAAASSDEIIVPMHAARSVATLHPDPLVPRHHHYQSSVTHMPSSSALALGGVAGWSNWNGGMGGRPLVPQMVGGMNGFMGMDQLGPVMSPMGMMPATMGGFGVIDPVIPTELPPLAGLPLLATPPVMTVPIPMQSTSIMAQAMGVWSESTPGGSDLQAISMFAVQPVEPRLFHTHDLVQIIVREASVSASFQGLETEKEYGLAGGVESFPGVNEYDPLFYTEFDVVGEKEFEGEGEYVREDELVTRLTAEVIEIRPNGNLVLEARTRIKTDDEEWYTQLTGTCRPEDVTAANTILSNQIFNLQVEKRHKGEVRNAASKGILAQALDAIFAF